MPKRSSYEIKKNILRHLRDKPSTYAQLERKINTGYRSVQSNCRELVDYDQVNVKKFKHPANGKISYKVSITEKGLRTLKKLG